MSLKTKFCPKCGKETKTLIDGLCLACYYKNNKIIFPKKINLTICKNCNSVLINNKWIKTDSWKYWLNQKLKKEIILPKNLKLEDIRVVEIGEKGKIRVWLSLEDETFTESRNIPIIIKEKLCTACKGNKNKLWNARIQLRADNKLIREIMIKLPKEFVTKIKPVVNGVDIYFSDKNKAKAFARNMKNKYNLESKSSFEQRGWNRLKNTSYKLPVILLKKS